MLKELLDNQRKYTDHFFTTLDLQPVEQLVQRLLRCSGMLFFTGVGKSGLVAKKIALPWCQREPVLFICLPQMLCMEILAWFLPMMSLLC